MSGEVKIIKKAVRPVPEKMKKKNRKWAHDSIRPTDRTLLKKITHRGR